VAPAFLEEWKAPEPHDAEEAGALWALFIRTIEALVSTFNLTKKEEEQVIEAVAEQVPFIEKPRHEIPSLLDGNGGNKQQIAQIVRRSPEQSGLPEIFELAERVRGRSSHKRLFRFPTYGLGKQAQLRLLRSAMSGRMPAYNANGTVKQFIYQYANSSPENEKRITSCGCARISRFRQAQF
jgi:hypothetical protein